MRWAVVDVLAGEIVGVFAHVERADEDGASVLEALDHGSISRRRLIFAIDLRPRDRRKSGNVEQILDCERHASQRSKRFAARARFVERTRTIVRTLFGQGGERIEQWIARANADERCLDKLQGAYTASRDFGGEVARFGPGPVIRRQRIKHKTPAPARNRLQAGIRRPASHGAGSI